MSDPSAPAAGEPVDTTASGTFTLVRVLRPCGSAWWLVTDRAGEVWTIEPGEGECRWRLTEADAARWAKTAASEG